MPPKDSEQDLFQLAHAGFADKLEAFFKKSGQKLKIDDFSKDGATALIQCVQGARVDPTVPGTDHAECCRVLLSRGANPNVVDKLGRTALHWAIFYKKSELVKVLLETERVNVTIEDKKGQNGVQFAVRMNAADCLKLICDNIADDSPSSKLEILSKPSASVGTPLIYATKLGHQECCKILLQAGANIDIKDQTYFDKTPLHISTELNNTEIMEMLIEFNANTEAGDAQGNTILHLSCTTRSPKALELILEKCSKIEHLIVRRNKEGHTPLMVASQMGFENHIKLLLEHKSPLDVQDEGGKTALHHAVAEGHRGCTELLLAADAGLPWTQDSEGRSPLHLAVIEGKKELVQLLVSNSGLNCKDNQGHTAIHWAVVCGFHDLIDTLVDHGGDPSLVDDHGASPLHYAAQMCGDPSVSEIGILCIKTLLKRGAKVNAIDVGHKTPLLWASSAGSSEACRLLKEAGADVSMADLDGLTALHCAVTCSHSDCVDTLLTECQCPVDIPDKNGCTPLFYACSMDQQENIKVLLDGGASPNHTDNNGKSPMHCAAGSASLDALRLLQEKGGSLDQEAAEGGTPFFEAVQNGDLDTIKFMIAHGCKADSVDRSGRTPLHIAATNSNLELCKYLVQLGVNNDAVCLSENGLPMTPLDCAWDSGAVPCMDYLTSVRAKRSRDLDQDQLETHRPSDSKKKDNRPVTTKYGISSSKDGSHPSKPRPATTKIMSSHSKNGPPSSKDRPKTTTDMSSYNKDRPKSLEDSPPSNRDRQKLKKDISSASRERSPSVKDDDGNAGAKKSPYAEPLGQVYDHAEARNEAERQKANDRRVLSTDPEGKKLGDWQAYVKDHVDFLDDLLSVKHERLETIQSHASQEKEFLIQRLEEIHKEMERRMELKASEKEKQMAERREQKAEEKKAMEERWKQIQQRYLGIDDSVAEQLTFMSQSHQEMDSKMVTLEKKIKKKKAEISSLRSQYIAAAASADTKRTQKHLDWLKRKNKEYHQKKNAVKLKNTLVVDCGALNLQMNRSASPSGKKSPAVSRIDHSHRTRSASPPYPNHPEHLHHSPNHPTPPPHPGSRNISSSSSPSGSASSARLGRPRYRGKQTSSLSSHPGHRHPQRWKSEEGRRRSGSLGDVGGRGEMRGGQGSAGSSARSGDSSRASSGPDSHSPTSHQLAQLRRNHGDSINRQMWPKSWELQDDSGMEYGQQTVYDLKRNFSPKWNGKLRPRHVLQFRSSAAGMSSASQQREEKLEA